MIALSGFLNEGGERCCSTATVVYIFSTVCDAAGDYDTPNTYYFEAPSSDPKKRKPFYRKVIALEAPPITVPKIIYPNKSQWKPRMGRVKINRSQP